MQQLTIISWVCSIKCRFTHPNAYYRIPVKRRLLARHSCGLWCGPYRDRTDDIHGVNVALYQLS
jgi:hypothetical protein